MRAGWGSRGAWLCGTHQLGMVARARCGRLIKPDEARDWGHDDENRSVHTGPEHVRCKRATLPRMLAKARDEDRFGGMPDADPGNAADRWSRHRYGGFNPRCAIAERPASRVRRRSGSPRRLHGRLPPGALAGAAGEPQVVGP